MTSLRRARGRRALILTVTLALATTFLVVTSPQEAAASEEAYRLPWDASETWQISRGPTSGGDHSSWPDFSPWDFFPVSLDVGFHALAVGSGTAKIICDDGGQATVELVTDLGDTFHYAHLDSDSVDEAGITAGGTDVVMGASLGTLYEDDDGWAMDCGSGTGAHLHFEIETDALPMVIDGYTFSLDDQHDGEQLTSTNVHGGIPAPPPPPPAAPVGDHLVGDFNGDGKDDAAQFDTGVWKVSLGSGSGLGASSVWATFGSGSGWTAHAAGDFDGDGKDDIANFNSGNGTWWISISTGEGFTTTLWDDFYTNSGWKRQVAGDFNGDGKDDIANYYPGNGTWWVSVSTGSSFTTRLWADYATTSGWTTQTVGDFNGDGKDDIANFNTINGTWWISKSTGSNFSTRLWADYVTTKGWVAQQAGDFNGDGLDDIANFYPGNGTWWISVSDGAKFTTSLWSNYATNSGWSNQTAGDFNGDGLDDIANYYAGNDTWWVSSSTGSAFTVSLWASGEESQDVEATAADIDANGVDDIAGYDSVSETWHTVLSTSASFSITQQQP